MEGCKSCKEVRSGIVREGDERGGRRGVEGHAGYAHTRHFVSDEVGPFTYASGIARSWVAGLPLWVWKCARGILGTMLSAVAVYP